MLKPKKTNRQIKKAPQARGPQTRGPQARGLARRRILESSADLLLQSKDIDQISLADVAEHADIPVASAYSFYNNISDLFAQLMIAHTSRMLEAVENSIDPLRADSWQEIIEAVIDAMISYYRASRPAQQLRLSGKALPEVRYTKGLPRGADFAPRVLAMVEKAFILPTLENGERNMLVMLDLSDGIIVSEFTRSGSLPQWVVREAKRAAIAYLKLYIPEYPPRRGNEANDRDQETQ